MSARGSMPSPRLTYVIGTYPLPTTTFIDREIDSLGRAGVDVRVISIRRPAQELSGPQLRLRDRVRYVLPVRPGELLGSHLAFLCSRPVAYLRTLGYLATRPHPSVRARIRTIGHFGIGVHVARLIRDGRPNDHIHAHFVDRAALVALVAGRLLRMPFSATAHAVDIYVDPVLLEEKVAGAKFVATCTRYNEEHLTRTLNGAASGRLRCIYHGLDARVYRRHARPRSRPLVLAVGQLKEKKGLRYLLEACRALIDDGLEFDCEIVGDGPLRSELEATIDRLRLRDRVALLGSMPHDAVIRKYAEASIFVLPCVLGSNGDRDGVPNAILEAMAMELPVVSTHLSGIPEAVEDGESGILVPPADAAALAEAIRRVLSDDDLLVRLGRAGRRKVEETFDVDTNVRRLLQEFAA